MKDFGKPGEGGEPNQKGKEKYKNLQVYLIKELYDFDWCRINDTL